MQIDDEIDWLKYANLTNVTCLKTNYAMQKHLEMWTKLDGNGWN